MVKKQYYCDYGQISSRNSVVYLHCTKINEACGFQRFCPTDQCIKHTNNFVNCKHRKGIDDMSKKKNYRKNEKTIQVNTLTKKEIQHPELGRQGDVMKTTKRMKVILVHPNYFIVDNNGQAKRIQGKTDLKAGDWYVVEIEPEVKQEVEKIEEVIKEEKIEIEKVEEVVEQIEEIPVVEVEMIEEE